MSDITEGKNLDSSYEYLHEPSSETKWRESYYFNWADLNHKISGFSTIGIVPGENKREFVFLLFLDDDKAEIYYREPELDEYIKDVGIMLKDKRLSYEMIEPLKTWKITYKSRKYEFDIVFQTRFSLYDFGKDSSASWHRHFEGSGTISGTLNIKSKRKIVLQGYGQRDKSWGYRDWHEFSKWYAGHFQFKEWSCGFRKDYKEDKMELSGFITNKQGNVNISEINIDVVNDNDKYKTPIEVIYEIIDENDKKYLIHAKKMNKRSYMRFARDLPHREGYTELFEEMVLMKDLESEEKGTGMSEFLRTVLI